MYKFVITAALWFLGSWWYYTKLKCDCDPAKIEAVGTPLSETNVITAPLNETTTPPPVQAPSKHVTDSDSDGLSDTEEEKLGTDPQKPDSDGDGIPDNEELGAELTTPIDTDKDSIIDALDPDDDNDGLSTLVEGKIGTSPLLKDTDGDGLDDAKEVGDIEANEATDTDNDGTIDALDIDDDDDGLNTANEILLGTNHLLADSDSDGISDKQEIGELTNIPNDSDSDGTIDALDNQDNTDSDNDGIPDVLEKLLGTNSNKMDSDDDGIDDIEEIGSDHEKPLDTDGNGVINALDTDDDGDTISTRMESALGTNPLSSDSDDDGIDDAIEIGSNTSNPLDSNDNGIIDALDKNVEKLDDDSDETDENKIVTTTNDSTPVEAPDETSVNTPTEQPSDSDTLTSDDTDKTSTAEGISLEVIKEADTEKPKSVRLYFPFNSEKPKVNGDLADYFTSLSSWATEDPKRMINITGHTDNIGGDLQNLALGMRRVMIIREILIEAGTPYQQIDVISRGERKPIADNGTKEGRFKNRRVELYPIPAIKE
ncbi:Calcium-binding acidic-repeat protein [Nymphon striatum]|nr:Calcium-binding acidic-repeat protein [Nymphon striatum]